MTKRTNFHLFFRDWLGLCLLCSLLAFNGLPSAKASQSQLTKLESGSAFERELKGGETHRFTIHLMAGQFLHVEVEQKAIDVTVTLIAPEARHKVTVDSPNGSYGPEPVVTIADVPGDYQLEVSASSNNPAGRYELKVFALREATAADRNHVAAEKAFLEALKSQLQRTVASQREAVEKYQQALQFFQTSAENRYRQALTLNSIGSIHANLGEFRKAADYFIQSQTLAQAAGARNLEASTLNNLGGVFDVLGETRKALNYYQQALPLSLQIGNKLQEANTLNNIGKIHSDLADWQKAVDYYSQALPLFRAVGDQRREGITLYNLGTAQLFMGDREKARDYFQQSLPLRRATGHKVGEAATLSAIGNSYVLTSEKPKAIELYNQARLLQQAAGDRLGEGQTLNYTGVAYLALGEHQKALETLQQALQLLRAIEDRRYEAITLSNIGDVTIALGQPEKAIEHYNQALATLRNIGDRQSEAKTLQGLARAERARGNFNEARKQIETALSQFEEVRARVGSEQLRASYLAAQQDAYQFYIDLLMQMHGRDTTAGLDAIALQTAERARARSLLEMLTEVHVDIRHGADTRLIEREREIAQQLNAKAVRAMQRNSPAQMEALKKEIGQLETEYQQVQTGIRKDNPRYAAITQPQPLTLAEIQRQLLDQDSLLLEYSLGEERSYLWAVTKDAITSYELPKRELIEKAAKQVTELLPARATRQRNETPPQRSQRIAEADAQLPEAARQLSEMILAPAAAQLSDKRLAVVPDGALQYIPFAMLPLPAGNGESAPLVVSNEVVTLPSASTLAVMRKELRGRPPAPKTLAVFADPVFSRNDPRNKAKSSLVSNKSVANKKEAQSTLASARSIVHQEEEKTASVLGGRLLIPRLPFTRQEADRILAVAPSAANLKATDFNASRATATDAGIGQYRYLHFATHGLLDTERPGFSALVLSLLDEKGNPQDGYLRAHEIYNLELPAELVVLSACQTGLGKEIKGEGLVGLTRGFMYAGAARVVVSLWNVNDRATAELMARFYEKMLKGELRPAAALRAAQVEMWRQKQWTAPYYWAAFVLQGEWK